MADSKPLIVRVAVPSPLRRTFDYLAPDNLQSTPPLRGCRVSIPFGKRHVVGLVIDCVDTSAFSIDKLKPIAAVIDQQPLLPESLFKLFIWAANYYQHPIGDALHSTLPVLLRRATPLPAVNHVPHWQPSVLGKGLGPDSLKRSPKQKALMADLLTEAPLRHDDLVTRYSAALLSPTPNVLLLLVISTSGTNAATRCAVWVNLAFGKSSCPMSPKVLYINTRSVRRAGKTCHFALIPLVTALNIRRALDLSFAR